MLTYLRSIRFYLRTERASRGSVAYIIITAQTSRRDILNDNLFSRDLYCILTLLLLRAFSVQNCVLLR